MTAEARFQVDPEADVLDEGFARRFLAAYLAAWNARRPEGLLALAADDVLWEDPTIHPGGRARGHEPVRAWLIDFWDTFPDMAFEHIEPGRPESAGLTLDRRTLIAPWRCRGTWDGLLQPPGLAPNGRGLTLVGVDLYRFRQGALSHVRTVVDTHDALQQLGVLPDPQSRAMRALAAAQRAWSWLRFGQGVRRSSHRG